MARCVPRQWVSRARFDFFAGEHDGYMRLPAPAKHVRSVLFIKGDYWIMRDQIETSGTHEYDLNFHFDPRCAPSIETGDNRGETGEVAAVVRARAGGASGLDLHAFAFGAWNKHDELHSTCYGAAQPAPVCTFSFVGDTAETFTLLVPRAASGAVESRAREIEAVGGRAFELRQGAWRDVVLVRADGAASIETAQLVSDFAWMWLRFRGDEVEPHELVGVGGQFLRLDGQKIVQARSRVSYAVARRPAAAVHDELIVETDATGADLCVAFSGAGRVEEQKGILEESKS
jgi:hypothetical protein